MKPVAAAVAGALIAGTLMYTVGARTSNVEAFTQETPVAESLDTQLARARVEPNAVAPARASVPVRRTATASAQPVARPGNDSKVSETQRQDRTWEKTALIIGGSAASGAGVGAIVDGKKGALIGAAIGGGAASIYEATRRR